MKKLAITLMTGFMLVGAGGVAANAQNIRSEAMDHPRIATAIREIESAIAYMEHAPHDFGGHKAAAIAAARAAVTELRAALAFRARRDR